MKRLIIEFRLLLIGWCFSLATLLAPKGPEGDRVIIAMKNWADREAQEVI